MTALRRDAGCPMHAKCPRSKPVNGGIHRAHVNSSVRRRSAPGSRAGSPCVGIVGQAAAEPSSESPELRSESWDRCDVNSELASPWTSPGAPGSGQAPNCHGAQGSIPREEARLCFGSGRASIPVPSIRGSPVSAAPFSRRNNASEAASTARMSTAPTSGSSRPFTTYIPSPSTNTQNGAFGCWIRATWLRLAGNPCAGIPSMAEWDYPM